MSEDWNTKYGSRRVRRDPPTLDEAIFAAIGITDDHGKTEFLLSPTTYQPVGLITRSPAVKVKLGNGATQDNGPQTSSIAIIQVSEVSAPGQR